MNEFKLLFYMIYKIYISLTSSSFFQTPCTRRPITILKTHISLHINHMLRQYFLFSPRLVENAELLETPLNLKTSVEWDLECVDFYFRQGVITRYYNELQRSRN